MVTDLTVRTERVASTAVMIGDAALVLDRAQVHGIATHGDHAPSQAAAIVIPRVGQAEAAEPQGAIVTQDADEMRVARGRKIVVPSRSSSRCLKDGRSA